MDLVLFRESNVVPYLSISSGQSLLSIRSKIDKEINIKVRNEILVGIDIYDYVLTSPIFPEGIIHID